MSARLRGDFILFAMAVLFASPVAAEPRALPFRRR